MLRTRFWWVMAGLVVGAAALVMLPAVLSSSEGGAALCGLSGASAQEDNPCLVQEATISALQVENMGLKMTLTAVAPPTATPVPPTATPMPVAMTIQDDAFLGPEDAPVVIVEFSDYQCPYCGRFYAETLPQIREKYPNEVKFVYRDFPIFGDDSIRVAMATECAEEQDAFWEMHDVLFDRQVAGTLDPGEDALVSMAGELGLDPDTFRTCLVEERYLQEVIDDAVAAQQYGLRGTPGFVINGVVYPFGAQPFEVFDAIISQELARLG